MLVKKQVKKNTTAFSRFIRDASSGEKKKVYKKVLQKSVEDQKKILEKSVA